MKIRYHKEFLKNYKKRITPDPSLSAQFKKQLDKFVKNPLDPTLRDHKLVGKKKSFRAFSIGGDIRVVYTRDNKGEIRLYDIGSHNQVY
jgi:addiction module RelE/StbE family toxin